jgi:hypothetical protein
MSIIRFSLPIGTVIFIFSLAGCMNATAPAPTSEPEPAIPTHTPGPTSAPSPTEIQLPLPTDTALQAGVPEPTDTPVPVPTPVDMNQLVQRLCPDLRPPLGLFSSKGPVYDTLVVPPVLYVPYDVIELNEEPPVEPCTLYLSPAPQGVPQFAGETLFWKSFDQEQGSSMVWKYDLNDSLEDNVFPQHPNLRQTRTNTSAGKSGMYDFVVAESGETLVWAYTDPQPYDENTMGYVRTMYASPAIGPIDQRPPVEIMNDFFPENTSGAGILRPRQLSKDEELVYFSLEPIGLGRTWPEPLGRISSLFKIEISWMSLPELVLDCGREYWCISDFSEQQNLVIQMLDGSIKIIALSSGDLIREVQAPESHPIVRQARIGPDGAIAFLGVAMGENGSGDPPESAAIFILLPGYEGEPAFVLEDAGMLNLIDWAGPGLLLVDGNNLGKNSNPSITPADLMLLDIETGVGKWLPHAAPGFVSLIK